MITLTEIKQKNHLWFSPENKRFFGDLTYKVMEDKEGNLFLIRKTNAWTDMFDGIKKPHYRINKITKELKIGELLDAHFDDLEAVKIFLNC